MGSINVTACTLEVRGKQAAAQFNNRLLQRRGALYIFSTVFLFYSFFNYSKEWKIALSNVAVTDTKVTAHASPDVHPCVAT